METANNMQHKQHSESSTFVIPDFSHRYTKLASGLDLFSIRAVAGDQMQTINGVLSILKKSTDSDIDADSAYYAVHAVRKELEDIEALMEAAATLANVNQIRVSINKLKGGAGLLCDILAPDDIILSNENICSSINLILGELGRLEELIKESFKTTKCQA